MRRRSPIGGHAEAPRRASARLLAPALAGGLAGIGAALALGAGPGALAGAVALAAAVAATLARDRRRALGAAALAERRTADVAGCVSDAVLAVDASHCIVEANERAAQLLGRPREELLGRAVQDELEAGLGAAVRADYERALALRRPVEATLQRAAEDRAFELWIHPTDEGAVVVGHEVTERRRGERRIADAGEQLRLALEAGRMGTWEWDVASGRVTWSETLEAVHGLDRGAFAGTYESFLAHVHPDDREAVAWHVHRAVEGDDDEFEIRFRSIRPDGEVRWIEGRARIVRDARHRATGMVGVSVDATERIESERTLQRSHALTEALAEALTPAEVAQVAARHGMTALGADACVVAALDELGRRLHVLHAEGAGAPAFVDPQADTPLAEAARSGEPILLSTPELVAEHYPALMGRRPLGALAALPLGAPGEGIGAVCFTFRGARQFGREERALLRSLAGQCSQALERARLYEREHRVAVTLQKSLLPERLPALEGAAVAARYLPGTPGIDVGGDWYDVVPGKDGAVALVIGDVVGRGVAAAASMGRLRNAVRAYALEGFPPARALERLNLLVETMGEGEFSTMIYAIFQPETGALRYARAGHPPPLVILPDGSPVFLEGGLSMPVGAVPEARFDEELVTLEPGSTLVLYTDGLVEGPERPMDEGLAELQQLARGGGRLEELLDRLVELAGADRRDDAALLALCPLPSPATRLRLRMPAEPASLAQVRARLRRFLEPGGLDDEQVYEIVTAASEAAANAIEHPQEATLPVFEVEAELRDGRVAVTVRDFGRWRLPEFDDERGRGLQFMNAFMDVDLAHVPSGTEVRMHRDLRQGTLA